MLSPAADGFLEYFIKSGMGKTPYSLGDIFQFIIRFLSDKITTHIPEPAEVMLETVKKILHQANVNAVSS